MFYGWMTAWVLGDFSLKPQGEKVAQALRAAGVHPAGALAKHQARLSRAAQHDNRLLSASAGSKVADTAP